MFATPIEMLPFERLEADAEAVEAIVDMEVEFHPRLEGRDDLRLDDAIAKKITVSLLVGEMKMVDAVDVVFRLKGASFHFVTGMPHRDGETTFAIG